MWTREWNPAIWTSGMASAPMILRACSAGRLAAVPWAEVGVRNAPSVLAKGHRNSSVCVATPLR